jgi:hypothetical protein
MNDTHFPLASAKAGDALFVRLDWAQLRKPASGLNQQAKKSLQACSDLELAAGIFKGEIQ